LTKRKDRSVGQKDNLERLAKNGWTESCVGQNKGKRRASEHVELGSAFGGLVTSCVQCDLKAGFVGCKKKNRRREGQLEQGLVRIVRALSLKGGGRREKLKK